MRCMIIVKAPAASEAVETPGAGLMAALADYRGQLARAGVLLDAAGLQPSAKGWRIRHEAGRRRVLDGPFAELNEQAAGYMLIQVRSREEALEWTRRFPAPFEGMPCEIEVRPLLEAADVGAGEAVGHVRVPPPAR